MMEIVSVALGALACVLLVIVLATRPRGNQEDRRLMIEMEEQMEQLRTQMQDELRQMRNDVNAAIHRSVQTGAELQASAQRQIAETQNARLKDLSDQMALRQAALQKTVNDQLRGMDQRMSANALENEQKLENIRATMEKRLAALQLENTQKLEEMRQTVDEKLQKTLEDKLHQSFSRVSQQLESVYKGLGEMQNLATGVGDLKKVLSNVKTRGILGEIQLGAILEQILAAEQYQENVMTVPGSGERVEYAVRLPGDGENPVWLPIDAKFPVDAYSALQDAYEEADAAKVESAGRMLEQRVRGFAKDIHEKYVCVPYTTEFAIMFVPVEGLYAELVRRGMVEKLQNESKIVLAGPTTMAALLNSLQMGFRTLAIQKRSGEVWQVLGNVKAEFDTFGKVLAQAQNRIEQAGSELEKLVGVRTRQIQRKLRGVTALPEFGDQVDSKESEQDACEE
ncbi:DNA recombination protein RmuC [uncultured Ruthenibacterium sp.]|uniref:DNA recombination protein RmuC n=1 Tax=uncultured Ruthenibacterium sp. TaxID=1905347 RepID=UPI00349E60FC